METVILLLSHSQINIYMTTWKRCIFVMIQTGKRLKISERLVSEDLGICWKLNLERKLDLRRKSERAHEPHRERPRETRQTEWWKRTDGRVILLCSHYFFLPDIVVWKMDVTADIIAFICNFLLHNSLASAPSKGDKYSPDEGREEAYSNVVAWTTRVLFQPP